MNSGTPPKPALQLVFFKKAPSHQKGHQFLKQERMENKTIISTTQRRAEQNRKAQLLISN